MSVTIGTPEEIVYGEGTRRIYREPGIVLGITLTEDAKRKSFKDTVEAIATIVGDNLGQCIRTGGEIEQVTFGNKKDGGELCRKIESRLRCNCRVIREVTIKTE